MVSRRQRHDRTFFRRPECGDDLFIGNGTAMVVRWTGNAAMQRVANVSAMVPSRSKITALILFMRRVIFVVRSYKHKADLLIAV